MNSPWKTVFMCKWVHQEEKPGFLVLANHFTEQDPGPILVPSQVTTLCYGIFVTLIFTLRTLRIWPFCDKVSAPRAQCLLPRLVSKLQAADALDNVPMSQRIVPIDWYYIIRFSVHFTSARSKFFLLDQSRMPRYLFMKDEHPPTTL